MARLWEAYIAPLLDKSTWRTFEEKAVIVTIRDCGPMMGEHIKCLYAHDGVFIEREEYCTWIKGDLDRFTFLKVKLDGKVLVEYDPRK